MFLWSQGEELPLLPAWLNCSPPRLRPRDGPLRSPAGLWVNRESACECAEQVGLRMAAPPVHLWTLRMNAARHREAATSS